jgi:hypothetical protein
VEAAIRYERSLADGRCVWDGIGLHKDSTILTAGAPGYEAIDRRIPALTSDQPEATVEFRLKRTADAAALTGPFQADDLPKTWPKRNISGVVEHAGKPVQGAKVRWGATNYESIERDTTTDVDGNFQLTAVSGDDGYITVIGAELAPAFVHIAREEFEFKINLETGTTARGTVVSSKRRLLQGVWVVPVISSPDRSLCNPLSLTERSAHTDELGHFEIRGLPERGVLFSFMREGQSNLRSQPLKLAGEENEVVMHTTGAVTGRVIGPDGNPVKNFVIQVNIPYVQKPKELVGGFFAGYCTGLDFSDSLGRFVISELPNGGVVRLTALAEGLGQVSIDRVEVHGKDELKFGERVTLQLTPPRKLAIHITEKNSNDLPIPKAVAILIAERLSDTQPIRWPWQGWEGAVRRESDASGVVQWNELSYDEGTLLVRAPGYAREHVAWNDQRESIAIALEKESVVYGTISVNGVPLADVDDFMFLTARNGDSFMIEEPGPTIGRFRFSELPPGEYTLEVMQDRKSKFREVFVVSAGESRYLEINIDPNPPPALETPEGKILQGATK